VARAVVASHDAQPVLDLIADRLRALLGASRCFTVLLGRDLRVRIAASSGLAATPPPIAPAHDRDGIVLTAMAERRVVSSSDVLSDPAFAMSPAVRRFVEAEGYRGAVAVPLVAATRVLGVLVAARAGVGAFSAEQVAIAETFADLAAAAVERARLSSLEAARTRLEATLIEVEREMLAELSVERLLPMILDRAGALVHAKGSIHLAESGRRWLRRAWSTLTEGAEGVPFGTGIKGICAETQRGILVADYARWQHAHPSYLALGVTSAMAQPLLSRGQLLGVITMDQIDPEAPPFGLDDLAVLGRLAGQAALALRNATLYGEAEQRRRAAQELARLARTLSDRLDTAALARQAVQSFASVFPHLSCTLRLLRSDGALVVAASTDFEPGHVQAPGTGLSARVLAAGHALTSQDRLREPGLVYDDDLRRHVEDRELHAGFVAPLLTDRGILGVLQVSARDAREFSSFEAELAQAYADQAGPALEGARLAADLRASEERTRRVIDTALDAVITIDIDGRIIGWNGEAERTFGWSRGEAMGRVLSEAIIPLRYRAAHEAGLRRFRESGEGPAVNRRLELSAIDRGGREFPVELSISPVSTGAVTTFTAFVRDITRRAEAERAIRRQTALVRLLQVVAVAANEAPTPETALQIGVDEVCAYTGWPAGDAFVLAGDGSGDLVPARIWHLDHAERDQRFREVTDASRFARGVGLPGRVLATGQATWIMDIAWDENFPRSHVARDSGLECAFGFPVLAGAEVVAVLEFFTGEPREPDAVLLEAMANIGTQLGRVFERQRSEAELRLAKDAAEAASRAKSSFLANMSHELRTPLNAILGYAQVLEQDAVLGPEPRRAVGVIERSGEHLLSLINEVLDLAKIESGTVAAQRAPFDLAGLLAGVADLMRARADGKGLAFACEYPAVLPAAVQGDDRRLRQVLTNLLDNAIKYTPEGGVRLGVARHDLRYRFVVEDTGVGISAVELPRIFETFHQIRGEQEFIEGTGLGLAISKTLVGLMGGALDVASTPGQGSRFWFDLELPAAESVPGGAGSRRRVARVRGDRRRVLVVDDKADNRELLRDLLTPMGFLVEEAPDAASCLARVAEAPFDAVLLDLRMPEMSGLEATRRLRALGGAPRLAIVAVSASVSGHHRDECITAGADDFLAKPFRLEQLLDLLCRHLGLEAIHDGEAVGPADEPGRRADAPAAFDVPSADVLAALLAHARRGDIKHVLELAGDIDAGDARYEPFARELRALARTFQVNRLCQLLERAISWTEEAF